MIINILSLIILSFRSLIDFKDISSVLRNISSFENEFNAINFNTFLCEFLQY
jgi:hypothetical protein